ncbi:MAG TPA: hypothetical protein VN444_04560 [Verrucomicrobiae bacterium]|nr:hypothetical protein [Verrucomicrobiae bacterium]
MIPAALMIEAIPLVMGLARLIRGVLPDEETKLLVRWANLLKDGPKNEAENEKAVEWKHDIRQFLSNLTLRRGFSPAYQYDQEIAIPEDLLTDIVDLLVGGWASSKWSLKTLTSNPENSRQGWAETVASGKPDLILAELTEWVARRGRTRSYSAVPAIRVDADWACDVGMFLIG